MILTEEEARTKWCHLTTVSLAPNNAEWQGHLMDSRGNLDIHYAFTRCIASSCPVWQWGDGGGDSGWQLPDGTTHWGTDSAKYVEGQHGQAAAGWLRVGYCGKGGKP